METQIADWHGFVATHHFWFIVAFVLGILQMMTDEFFFGGACLGAILTAVFVFLTGDLLASGRINISIPFIVCGAGGILGAILMRYCFGHHRAARQDINDDVPYKGDDS